MSEACPRKRAIEELPRRAQVERCKLGILEEAPHGGKTWAKHRHRGRVKGAVLIPGNQEESLVGGPLGNEVIIRLPRTEPALGVPEDIVRGKVQGPLGHIGLFLQLFRVLVFRLRVDGLEKLEEAGDLLVVLVVYLLVAVQIRGWIGAVVRKVRSKGPGANAAKEAAGGSPELSLEELVLDDLHIDIP